MIAWVPKTLQDRRESDQPHESCVRIVSRKYGLQM